MCTQALATIVVVGVAGYSTQSTRAALQGHYQTGLDAEPDTII